MGVHPEEAAEQRTELNAEERRRMRRPRAVAVVAESPAAEGAPRGEERRAAGRLEAAFQPQ